MQVIHKPKPKPELMTQTELLAYVHELEAENARPEEGYQKSVGVIAATDCVKCKKDAEPVKHACWTHGTRGADSYLRCTNCHKIVVNNIVTLEGDAAETAFERCPYCGTRMDGGAADV